MYALDANDDSKPLARITVCKPDSVVSNSSGLTFQCHLKNVQHKDFVSLFKNKEPIDGVPWSTSSANLMQQDDGSWVHVVKVGGQAKVCLSDHFVFRFVREYTGVKPAE